MISVALQVAGSLATVAVGVGVVATGAAKVVGVMRKFNDFINSWTGNGDHPSIPDRLGALETALTVVSDQQGETNVKLDATNAKLDANGAKLEDHTGREVPAAMAAGRAEAAQIHTAISELGDRVSALEGQRPTA